MSNVVDFPVRKSAQSVALVRADEKGAYPWGFVVGDFNEDGKLDVAAGQEDGPWCRGYSSFPGK